MLEALEKSLLHQAFTSHLLKTMREDSFSRRHGLAPEDPPIIVRAEAPQWLRDFLLATAYGQGLTPEVIRGILCVLLYESPNRDNWSSGNIAREVNDLLSGADWFHVYDLIEELATWLQENKTQIEVGEFERELNRAFRVKGVGWQLIGIKIETRGSESFETTVRSAIELATAAGKKVAAREMHEALQDLSRRPNPDITGAIQHAMAALECVARDATGDEKSTLGEWLKRNPGVIPPPLDEVMVKLWGFTSNNGRHLRENQPPVVDEAELVVALVGALSAYLIRKSGRAAARGD